VVEWPRAVCGAAPADVFDRLFQTGVRGRSGEGGGGPEVVEDAEDVVVPAVGMEQGQVFVVGGLSGAQPTKQVAAEQILLA